MPQASKCLSVHPVAHGYIGGVQPHVSKEDAERSAAVLAEMRERAGLLDAAAEKAALERQLSPSGLPR